MNTKYETLALGYKALADANRVRIMEMLQEGELCACELLEDLQIRQPTLSYHMNILAEAKLVSTRKDGKKTLYTIQEANMEGLRLFLGENVKKYKE